MKKKIEELEGEITTKNEEYEEKENDTRSKIDDMVSTVNDAIGSLEL